jgi:hypothetical protein
MTNNNPNIYINQKPTEEIQYLENKKIQLPSVAEIQKNGISAELKAQLLDPQASFSSEIEVRCLRENCSHDFYLRLTIGYEGF